MRSRASKPPSPQHPETKLSPTQHRKAFETYLAEVFLIAKLRFALQTLCETYFYFAKRLERKTKFCLWQNFTLNDVERAYKAYPIEVFPIAKLRFALQTLRE